VDKGNTSDSVQFVKIVDDIIGDLRDDSLFVFDAGGDAKQVLDRITERKMRYITRKRMNKSDDLWISKFDKEDAICVDESDGVYCQRKTFESSGRTVYLFYSDKLYKDKMAALDGRSWRCVEDAKETMRRKKDGTLRISKTVIKRLKNPLISLNVGVQGKLLSNDVESFKYVRNELSNRREGFFMQFEFDTCGGVLDLPQTGYRREAHGLVEEPYRPQTVACLVRKLGKRNAFAVFFSSGDRFHGQIRDAGIEVSFNKIHHRFPTKFDSYVCLRS
jgi:hypothetical protein